MTPRYLDLVARVPGAVLIGLDVADWLALGSPVAGNSITLDAPGVHRDVALLGVRQLGRIIELAIVIPVDVAAQLVASDAVTVAEIQPRCA